MILVTGGAGFIGANFVLAWLAQSNEAVVNLQANYRPWPVAAGTTEFGTKFGRNSCPHNAQGHATCPEEIAYRQGFINAKQLEKLAQPRAKNGYGQYLQRLLKEGLQP